MSELSNDYMDNSDGRLNTGAFDQDSADDNTYSGITNDALVEFATELAQEIGLLALTESRSRITAPASNARMDQWNSGSCSDHPVDFTIEDYRNAPSSDSDSEQNDFEGEADEPRPVPSGEDRPAKIDLIAREQQRVQDRFNTRFEKFDLVELERMVAGWERSNDSVFLAIEGHRELIKRYDCRLQQEDFKRAVESIESLQHSLEAGKEITVGPDGKPTLSEVPLTEERRYQIHVAIASDFGVMERQVTSRMALFAALRSANQFASAEDCLVEAKSMSDRLPINLIRKEQKLLVDDLTNTSSSRRRQEMQVQAEHLMGTDAASGMIKLPLTTRTTLAQFYLGTQVHTQPDARGEHSLSITFGGTNSFKPDKAYEIANEMRAKTKEILGFDPLDKGQAGRNPAACSLFGALVEVFDNPDKFNIYNVVERHSAENIRNALRESTKTHSMLLDVGTVALVGTTMALSRSQKVAAMFERSLGGYANGGARIAGAAAAAVASPLYRHYGYELVTGTNESWVDTGVHVLGSVAAAEVGSRIVGRGSMFVGGPASGPGRFHAFDKTTSAQWYAHHGYETTGKLAGVLERAGFQSEAKILAELAPTTSITSEQALRAIEAAELTHARVGTVAAAISGQTKAAERIGHTAIQREVAESNLSSAVLATPQQLARSRSLRGFGGAAATATIYNSTSTAWDIHNTRTNRETGQKYSILEALQEAHLPTVDTGVSRGADMTASVLLGTAGESLLAGKLLKTGAIYSYSPAQSQMRTLFHNTPVSPLAWNNWGARAFSGPTLGGAGTLGATLFAPAAGSFLSDTDRSVQYQEMWKNIQTPITDMPRQR